MNATEIGNRIAEERGRAKLSQEELSELAQVHRVTLARIETGKHVPSFKTLVRLSEALKVEPMSLIKQKNLPENIISA